MCIRDSTVTVSAPFQSDGGVDGDDGNGGGIDDETGGTIKAEDGRQRGDVDDGDDGGQEAQGTNWVFYQAPYLSHVDAVCPLTRDVLVDPVRSKKCGHVYSLKSIKAGFKKKQKCACFGCKVELDINDFERLDIDVRGAVWRRDDRDGRLLRL